MCGVLLGSGSLLQQAGIQFTTAGKAGFLTALYIVIVPVLGIFLGRRPGAKVWIGVMIALVGAYLLSVTTGEAGGLAIGPGDLLVLLSAVFFSLHILTVDRVAGQLDGVALSCVQFFVAGVLSTVLALFLEKPDFSGLLQAWGPLLYTGVLSSGVAYTLQILGQQRVQPTVASLILSLGVGVRRRGGVDCPAGAPVPPGDRRLRAGVRGGGAGPAAGQKTGCYPRRRKAWGTQSHRRKERDRDADDRDEELPGDEPQSGGADRRTGALKARLRPGPGHGQLPPSGPTTCWPRAARRACWTSPRCAR